MHPPYRRAPKLPDGRAWESGCDLDARCCQRGAAGVQDDGAAGSHTAWTPRDQGSPPTLRLAAAGDCRGSDEGPGLPWPPHPRDAPRVTAPIGPQHRRGGAQTTPLSPWQGTWEPGPWSLTSDLAGVVASRLPAWSEKWAGGVRRVSGPRRCREAAAK